MENCKHFWAKHRREILFKNLGIKGNKHGLEYLLKEETNAS